MASKFVPLNDRILVKEFDVEKIVDGIFLPESGKDDMKVGKVAAVGSSIKDVAAGDRIAFGPYAGIQIQIEGVMFKTMREGEVIGKFLDDEKTDI